MGEWESGRVGAIGGRGGGCRCKDEPAESNA